MHDKCICIYYIMSMKLWFTGNEAPVNRGLMELTWTPDYILKDDGKTGKCINFNGHMSDEITMPDFDSDTVFSISFWTRCSSEDGDKILIKFGSDSNELYITKTTSGRISVQQQDIYGDIPYESVTHDTITNDEWTHVIYTHNPIKKRFQLVVDSVFEDTYALSESISTGLNGIFQIGYGDFCDLRVYNHELSKHEISLIYKSIVLHHRLSRGANPEQFDSVLYSTYGLTDCSGFFRNADYGILQRIEWSPLAPVSYGSLKLDGTNYLKCPSLTLNTNDITIMVWVYMEDWSVVYSNDIPLIYFMNSAINLIIQEGLLKINLELESDTLSASVNTTSLSAGWHLFAISKSNECMKVFIDDTEYASVGDGLGATTEKIKSDLGDLLIGKGSDDTIANNILLCDLRIYVTDFSADDIKKHFEGRVGIDDHGNIFAYDAIDGEYLGIGGKGVVKGNIVESVEGFKIYSDRYECSDYFEI